MAQKNKKPNEIYIQRLYKAPVKMVWEAWTDPQQAALWWGPRGFTITTHSKDLKPGGHWNYTMHGPDGVDYPNKTVYFEVEKYSKLVYDHGANDNQPALFRVTVTFQEINGQTQMDMTMALSSAEAATEIKKFIKQANGNSTWDRLGEYLVKEQSKKEIFVINRNFEIPIEKMFDLWTQPSHFSKWLPPTGFNMEFIHVEIKPGGSSFYVMKSLDGKMSMYGKAHYIEITKPHRLVYTQQFCDEKGNVSRHPMAPTWPETMQTTVEFFSEGAHDTRVCIQWEVAAPFNDVELQTFVNGRTGMTMGWTGSFDKLEEYINQQK